MIEIKSAADFDKLAGDYLLDFSAEWCAPCKFLAPILEDVAKSTGTPVYKIDVDECSEIAEQYGVKNIPAVFMIKGGQPVDLIVGAAKKEAYEAMIKKAGEAIVGNK